MPFSLVLFTILVLTTCYVGYQLLGLLQDSPGLPTLQRHALALPVGFGVFSVATGPLLLLQAPYQFAVWMAAFTGLSVCVAAWRFPSSCNADSATTSTVEFADCGTSLRSIGLALLIVSAVIVTIFATQESARKFTGVTCVLLTLGVSALSARLTREQREATATPADLRGEPLSRRAEWILAAACAVALVVGATVWVREDADDVLYLSEALWLQDSPAMGATSPVHRGEALPSTVIYAWQAFELWGGMLADIADLPVLVAFRTALAPILVIASLLLYLALLQTIVPRDLVPIALLAVLAYISCGTTSLFAGNSYLLIRAAQGKAWLIHVGFPALALATFHYLQRPQLKRLGILLLVSFACLGFSPTSVFTCPAILAVLLIATCLSRSRQPINSRAWGGIALAVLPFIMFGIYVALRQADDEIMTLAYEKHPDASTWAGANLFYHLGLSHGGGAIELFLLMASPLVFAVTKNTKSNLGHAYPAAFTILYAALALNPLLFSPLVATIGYNATSRFLWAVPFPILAGLVAAWVCRPLSPNWQVVAAVLIPCVMLGMGGRLIWSAAALPNSSGPAPYLTQNVYKMPDGLLAMAQALAQEVTGPDHRILCSPRVASHLSPYDRNFNFVYARSFQTDAALTMAGRAAERERRRRLASEFLTGETPTAEWGDMLAIEKVQFVVLSAAETRVVEALRQARFKRIARRDAWQLWKFAPSQ